MREPRAPVRPWQGRSTAGLGLWSWLRRRLCGCSPRCPCCCRRGKIKYFSFRSFTRFTSGERDAPESQVRLAPRGCWVPGARVGAGTGTRLCPVPVWGRAGPAWPWPSAACQEREGAGGDRAASPSQSCHPSLCWQLGLQVGAALVLGALGPLCCRGWHSDRGGDRPGTGSRRMGTFRDADLCCPQQQTLGRRGCTFPSDSSGRKGPDPAHPSQRWEQRDRAVLGRSSAAARDTLGRQQLHGDVAAQGQGCSHCQELLGTRQAQQDQDSPGHSPVAGWAPESRGGAKRRAEEPEGAGSPAAG